MLLIVILCTCRYSLTDCMLMKRCNMGCVCVSSKTREVRRYGMDMVWQKDPTGLYIPLLDLRVYHMRIFFLLCFNQLEIWFYHFLAFKTYIRAWWLLPRCFATHFSFYFTYYILLPFYILRHL